MRLAFVYLKSMRIRPNPAAPISGPLTDLLYPKDLLDGLNGKRDFGREQRSMTSAAERAPDADYRAAKDVFERELRRLVDAWLDSGRVAGEVFETPRDRRVEVTIPNLGAAENRTRQSTVFDSVQRWLMESPPLIFLAETGELRMSLRQPPKWWEPGQVDEPITAALDEARTLFLLLMASKAKYALFKCSHPRCGLYFILEKARRGYKFGAVCPEHRRQQGTRRQRTKDRAEALQVAALALAMWPKLSPSTRSKHKSEKHYIASKLKRFDVGTKWVTRNLAEIKGEVTNDA